MNLDILNAAVYDTELQCLKLKGDTAGISDDSTSFARQNDDDEDDEEDSERDPYLCVYSTSTSIHWDFVTEHDGELDVAIHIATSEDQEGAELEIEVHDQKLTFVTPFTGGPETFATYQVGSVVLNDTGRITVKMQARYIKDEDEGFGRFAWLQLSGPAAVDSAEDMVAQDLEGVYLEALDEDEYELCCMSVTPTSSHKGTVFQMFNCGAASISLTDETPSENKMIEVVHPADQCEGDPDANQQDGVDDIAGPGMEHHRLEFPWNIDETYHFVIKSERIEDAVMFSAYVYSNEAERWKYLVTYTIANNKRLLTSLGHRISEKICTTRVGYFVREALIGPTWCRLPNGDWKEITCFEFNQDGTLLNVEAGVRDNRPFLRTGGHTVRTCELRTKLTVESGGELPQMLQDIDQRLAEAVEMKED